ncbi:MAG: hypothetical protein GDA43_19615 [Hormoscilla sp. SP5CHS1]|nr:hypothetical protein [Hormoscilla sp. SP5CHS1]
MKQVGLSERSQKNGGKKNNYEALLAEYSNTEAAIELLKQYRPYLEMIPSMRRSDESLITIPMPVVRIRPSDQKGYNQTPSGLTCLPCEVGILMCDPEWKIKTGTDIFVFIHRRNEDFSDLLGRWRHTQVWLDRGYEWLMPPRYKHIFGEGSEQIFLSFVVFAETPERIKRGLEGAYLPFVVQTLRPAIEEETTEYLGVGQLK